MNETANIEHHGCCDPLLELATPHIYRRNLFRVLGLPVNASPKDVQRQQNRRKMREKLGIGSSDGPGGPLALDPPPSEEDIRAAMDRLNSPIDRLLDEIFWFWPTNGNVASDEALKAAETGDVKKAAAIWMGLAKSSSDGHIATHNLAVLDHLVALDYEAKLTTGGLSEKVQQRLEDLWLRGFARWEKVITGEDFWSVVKDRVRDLNDAQLTTGFVRRARKMLPTALLLINAKIAYQAAERSDLINAKRHVKLLREVNFSDGLADQAVREAIKPIRNRIKTAVDTARSRWTQKPHKGHQNVRELYEQSQALLATVDAILPPDNLTRAGMHDTVAEAMLEGQVAFGKKTNDWQECIKLIDLALGIAQGDPVRTRLTENREILETNAETGNDWCAPGYWDLSGDVIDVLESARELCDSGSFDKAIEALVVLDPQIGKPLRRALAYCLSLRGIHEGNDALNEYEAESGVLKEIMDKLRDAGEAELRLLLLRRPNPNSYVQPPCLCCGSSSYTSWMNFTYRDIPMFMCSSCNARHDRELESQKRSLRGHIATALEYMLLADEVDPGDAGVKRNLKALKDTAKNVDCNIPKTKALKKRLGAQTVRGTRTSVDVETSTRICHFCDEAAAEDTCSITVPMCGNVQPVRLLFNNGIEYQYADVSVPRCRRCRDEHRELPGRVEKWHEARLAASDYSHFPEEAKAAIAAKKAASAAETKVEECKKAVEQAEAATGRVDDIGANCDRCHLSWGKGLCRQCDEELFKLGTWPKVGIVVAGVVVLMTGFTLQRELGIFAPVGNLVASVAGSSAEAAVKFVPLLCVLAVPVLAMLSIVGLLKRKQWRKRREVRSSREADIERRRREARTKAQAELEEARSAFTRAVEVARDPLEAHQSAKKALREVREKAIAEFERVYTKPRLITGIKPEGDYSQYLTIIDLRQRGWGFGHEIREDGSIVADGPSNVTGLVAREPLLCSDGNCIGLTGPDGRCKECGQSYEGALPETFGQQNDIPKIASSENSVSETSAEPSVQSPAASSPDDSRTVSTSDASSWENRVLCSDGNCIGLVGPDGRCKECGKPYAPDAEDL